MVRITVRDLHMKTGEWVRRVADEERIVVTHRGTPIASLVPYSDLDAGTLFSRRRLTRRFRNLPRFPGDSTRLVSEDRGAR